jgi:glycosyltransferase involved in cell wall biosynthesis
MDKLVSILIVVYNAEKFIEKTIKSCLSQSYDELEILILDNSSTDQSVKIIENMGSDKIRLYKGKNNLGPYNGLNYLLEKAKGKYIAIQDHDDIWLPDKIKSQVEFLDKNLDFIACGTDVYYFFEERDELALKKLAPEPRYVNHTSLMFRNSGFRYNLEKLFPDEYFEKEIIAKKGRLGCIQEGLVIHRVRGDGNNFSRVRSKISFSGALILLRRDKFSLESLKYIIYLFFRRHLPNRLAWFLRKKVTMKKFDWISKKEFMSKFPQVDF